MSLFYRVRFSNVKWVGDAGYQPNIYSPTLDLLDRHNTDEGVAEVVKTADEEHFKRLFAIKGGRKLKDVFVRFETDHDEMYFASCDLEEVQA
jgi:hypothetical protein